MGIRERRERLREFNRSEMLMSGQYRSALIYVAVLSAIVFLTGIAGLISGMVAHQASAIVKGSILVGLGLLLLMVVVTGFWSRRRRRVGDK